MISQSFVNNFTRALASLALVAASCAIAQKVDGFKPQAHGQDYVRQDTDKRVLDAAKFNWPNVFPGEEEVGVFKLSPDSADGCPHGVFVMSLGNPAKRKDWDDIVAAKASGKLVEISSNQKGHKYNTEPCVVKNVKVK